MKKYDLVIVGGGSAGLGAALSTSKDPSLSILLVEKDKRLGGILNQCIHDGFGLHLFKETLTGPEYAYRLEQLLIDSRVQIMLDSTITKVTANKQLTLYKAGSHVETIRTNALILTSGSYERNAGAINLPGARVAGIMSAGQAQLFLNTYGYFFAKRVLIVGSGDIGLIMARRLSLLGVQVVAVSEIMPYSSGLKRNIVQCLDDYDIPLYLSHKVIDVQGETRVNKVIIAKTNEDGSIVEGSEKPFEVDGLLLAVGLIPYVALADKLGIATSKSRGPIVNNNYQTSLPWFFVAGNALHIHDLADEAFFEGEEAGSAAASYIKTQPNYNVTMAVKPLKDINYVIPNIVNLPLISDDLVIKFRVKSPLINKRIVIKIDDHIIYKKFFPFLIPSELISVKLNKELIVEGEVLSVEVRDE